ncbi:3089_t:CDS:1, partial [Cetraspora pellucida]
QQIEIGAKQEGPDTLKLQGELGCQLGKPIQLMSKLMKAQGEDK